MDGGKVAAETTASFTHDALVIRTCGADGSSYSGFKYPMTVGAVVECPDWKPTAECGNGLHGLLDGCGDWGLIEPAAGRVWQIIGVKRSEVVAIDNDKVKFPRGVVLYVGPMGGAMKMIQQAAVDAIKAKAADKIATGDRGHAAATGYRGHAAATGPHSCAISVGPDGTAQGALGTWLTLAAWKYKAGKYELKKVATAQIDGKKIKADTPYRLSATGKVVKATA